MKLTPEQYWEYRCTINEMDLAKKDLDVNTLKYEMMIKDQEIARLKSVIFKHSLGSLNEKHILAKKEYERFKKALEESLGISLDGCSIDGISFEIVKDES